MSDYVSRTANLVAQRANRLLPNGIGTVVPTGAITQAMGIAPSTCIVTVALLDIGANQAISCYVFSQTAFLQTGNGWLKAGCVAAKYQLTFEARGMDAFVVPEDSPYFLVASVGVAANAALVNDRGPHAANPLNVPY